MVEKEKPAKIIKIVTPHFNRQPPIKSSKSMQGCHEKEKKKHRNNRKCLGFHLKRRLSGPVAETSATGD